MKSGGQPARKRNLRVQTQSARPRPTRSCHLRKPQPPLLGRAPDRRCSPGKGRVTETSENNLTTSPRGHTYSEKVPQTGRDSGSQQRDLGGRCGRLPANSTPLHLPPVMPDFPGAIEAAEHPELGPAPQGAAAGLGAAAKPRLSFRSRCVREGLSLFHEARGLVATNCPHPS